MVCSEWVIGCGWLVAYPAFLCYQDELCCCLAVAFVSAFRSVLVAEPFTLWGWPSTAGAGVSDHRMRRSTLRISPWASMVGGSGACSIGRWLSQ